MLKRALKVMLALLLLVVVLAIGIAVAGYLYLVPDKEPKRLPHRATVRSVESGEVVGFPSKHDTHAWLGIETSCLTA